jgi:hypothetical protein
MLQRRSRREAKRRNQRRYEARQRAGIGLFPVPLTGHEIEVLVNLGWLREGAESDRENVGRAVAAAIRELAISLKRC